MSDTPAVDGAFVRVLFDDNQRLRQALAETEAALKNAKADAARAAEEAESELIKVVGLCGGRVERTAGISRDDVIFGRARDPKFPKFRNPRLRRVHDDYNCWVSAWVLEEQAPALVEDEQAA